MKGLYFALISLSLAVACSTDTPVTPNSQDLTFALRAPAGGVALSSAGAVLVVDDDGADCSNAGHNTIQAAVNAADAGATIFVCAGTYNERVVIPGPAKNGLRLLAKGAPGTVVLDGNDRSFFPGNHAFHVVNATGVLIEGFTVREYFENIRMTGGGGHTVRKNSTTNAGHDGIFAANSANNLIEHNVSFDNPSGNACGVNIAGSAAVGNLIRHNLLIGNQWGIRIQGGATNTVAFGNESRRNRSHGIVNVGAATNGSTIENNDAHENPFGIEVQGSSGVRVLRNRAFNNVTFDLVLSGSGTNNQFVNNHCGTSMPDGLCAHGEGASK